MQTSDWISIVAILVSALSPIYARSAVLASRLQNEISLLNKRLKLYKGFLDFRAKLTAYGTEVKERDRFLELYEHVQLSEFYFSKDIHLHLKSFFECTWEVVKLRGLLETVAEQEEDKRKELVNRTHAMLKECREKAVKTEEVLKKELRLVKT